MDLSLGAYLSLIEHLGVSALQIPLPNAGMEILPDPTVMADLGVDILSVKLGRPQFLDTAEELPAEITDGWGVTRKLTPHPTGAYYEIISHPLSGAGRAELEDYTWPECDPDEVDEELRTRARNLHSATEFALMGRFGGPILEIAAALVGTEEWYVRLIDDSEFVAALLDHITDVCTALDLRGINSCGQWLQIMKVSGEDLGMQTGLLYSPTLFQDIILPPLRRRWRLVGERLAEVNPETRIMLHSCGAVSSIIPYLAESGIDILDPVQPNAAGMDPGTLNASFGDKMVFHGGIDTQHLLPFGTPEEVRQRTIDVLDGFNAVAGGFIAGPSHCLQPDVPSQNVLAMIDAVKNYGTTGSRRARLNQ